MKKHFLIFTLLFVFGISFANTNFVESSNIAEKIENNEEINIDLTFNSIEELKNFKPESFRFDGFSFSENLDEDCEASATVSVTVEGEVGIPGVGSVGVSATVSITVTATCAEIADAITGALATARSAALSQIMN